MQTDPEILEFQSASKKVIDLASDIIPTLQTTQDIIDNMDIQEKFLGHPAGDVYDLFFRLLMQNLRLFIAICADESRDSSYEFAKIKIESEDFRRRLYLHHSNQRKTLRRLRESDFDKWCSDFAQTSRFSIYRRRQKNKSIAN